MTGDVAATPPVASRCTASAEHDLTIHRHEGPSGKTVIYDTELSRVRERSGKLRQERKREWCWMWSNKSASDVTVRVDLKR